MDKIEMLKSVHENNVEYAKKLNSIDLLERIMKSMDLIDRKFFAGEENKVTCYDDEALSIGYGQTISQPTTVARMLLLSQLKRKMDVLEIGSGSGWNAALAAYLVRPGKVISTERIKELRENAQNNLNNFMKKTKLKLNVEFLHTDTFDKKSKIWEERYDRIITTAGANIELMGQIKNLGVNLLKNHGSLLYPTNEFGSQGALELWKKEGNKLKRTMREEGYAFVPLLQGEEK